MTEDATIALLAKVGRQVLNKQLTLHEGRRSKVYNDTKGIPTIGIGRNLRDRGLREDEIDFLFNNDLADHTSEVLRWLPWVADLDPVRAAVLIDMSFMGVGTLLKFRRFLASVQAGNYERAAVEMLESLWAEQVGQRALTLADMMRTGVSPFAK